MEENGPNLPKMLTLRLIKNLSGYLCWCPLANAHGKEKARLMVVFITMKNGQSTYHDESAKELGKRFSQRQPDAAP